MSVMTANASSTMAPWGGKTPFFGTNPWSFGAPRDGDPLVIDSSSSATAFVNLANAASSGTEIPMHWALDCDGQPTADPQRALNGSIAPAGGHKGSALALMVEVMAAGLTGAHWSYQASSLGDDIGGPPRLGQTVIAIRPGSLGRTDFTERLDEMIAMMCADTNVRVPGNRRHVQRTRHEAFGVSLTSEEADMLSGLAVLPS